jgi:hypothetical protein
MKVEFKKLIGKTEFTFHAEVNDLKDFFKQISIYEDIPVIGPNGEDDLKITYRKTPNEGYEYFSVVSEKAGMEFKFGQSKDLTTMFPKGWEPLYQNNNVPQEQAGGLGAPAPTPGLGNQPVQNQAPPAEDYAPAPVQNTPAQNAPAQTPATTAQNQTPQNGADVNSILNKYGING